MSALINDYYGLSKVLLEDCPFCGSDELTIVMCNNDCESSNYDYPYLFYVLCRECLSRGAKKVMEEDAIDVWNERANHTETQLVKTGEWLEDEYAYFRCSECGYEQDQPETVTPYCPGCGTHMENYEDVNEE